jgi:hypothetical protein
LGATDPLGLYAVQNVIKEAVDSSIKELEQKFFDTKDECDPTCGSYPVLVAYTFASYVSYTQYVEQIKKQKATP